MRLPFYPTRANPFVDLHADERDPFRSLMQALFDTSPETLRAWLKEGSHGAAVKDVAADAVIALRPRVPERTRATGGAMSLHDALHWAHARAQELVGATVFEGEKMKDDTMGASMSTYPMLLAYTEESDPDAIPLATHAIGIETLRTHAGTKGTKGGQLPRGEWEAAYEAIRAAAEAQGVPMPEPESRPSLRSPKSSPESGLPDGGEYKFDPATGRVIIAGSFSRKHNTALLPMLKKAVVDGRLSQDAWFGLGKEGNRYPISVDPRYAVEVAATIEGVYPTLAGVLRQHAAYWQGLAGGAVPEAEAEGVVGDSSEGRVPSENLTWWLDRDDKLVQLAPTKPFALSTKEMRDAVGIGATQRPGGPVGWFVTVPMRADSLEKAAAYLDSVGKPLTAAAFRTYAPEWVKETRSSLEQTRERGEVKEEQASWTLVEEGTTATGKVKESILLFLPYVVRYPLTTEVRGATYDSRTKGVYVKPKDVPVVAQFLRDKGLPRFAEALTRAFGGVKGVADEEEEHCRVMLSMSHGMRGAVTVDEVNDPKALEAIEIVRNALRQRVVNPKLQPYPFQLIGMAFAKLTGYRTMIADAPGLGKTVQAIGTMLTDPEMLLPAIIVSPKNVAGNWMEELETWMPRVKAQLVTSQTLFDPTAQIYVMGYETLRSRIDQLLPMSVLAVPTITEEIAQLTAQMKKAEAEKKPISPGAEKELERLTRLLKDAEDYPAKNRIKYFVADEAHKFKNPTAKWSKAARELSKAVPHVLFLSGTPMMNNVAELHSTLSMLHPTMWGSESAFKKQYTDKKTVEKVIKGKKKKVEIMVLKNGPELHKRMGCQIIRRRKMDAFTKGREGGAPLVLPKKRKKVPICVTSEEAKVYDEAVRQYEKYVRERAERIVKALVDREIDTFLAESKMERADVEAQERTEILHNDYDIRKGYFDDAALRARGIPLDDVVARAAERADEQIEALLASKGMTSEAIRLRIKERTDEAVEQAMKAEILTQLGRLLELIGQFKVPSVVDMIKAIHAQKAPARVTKSERVAPEGVVIFAKHGSVMKAYEKALREAGIKVGVISGDAKSTPEARMKVVKDFQNGDIDVVLASEAGREGLTLTRAKYLIMAQRYWNPAAEQQAEDRIHRIGQKRDATILIPYIVRANAADPDGATADDYMQRIIASKRGLVGEAIGDDEIEESTLSEDEVSEEVEDLLEGTSEEFSIFATVKALRKGNLCVDPDLSRSSVAAVRREAETGYETEMRQNPRAFAPAAVPSRSEVQTVLFDRRAWSKAAAETWLRHHGYDARKVDTTEHYHRFRQHDPYLYVPGSFRTISFTSSIKAVVGRRA